MEKSHPLSTPMVVRSLDVEKDPFRPPNDAKEILGPEVPYLSAIGALMFLASHTRPDISFSLNLLARYSSCPTKRHWNGVKQIFRYLQGTKDMGLYFINQSKQVWLVLQMQGICLILTLGDLKLDIYLQVEVLQFHGVR